MATKPADRWDPVIPCVIPVSYLRIAEERGIAVEPLLQSVDLPLDFADHPTDLRMAQAHQLILAVLGCAGDDGLGLDIGWRLPPTAFGNLGYALLCSATLRDALALCRQYWHLVARGTQLSVREEGDWLVADITLLLPMPQQIRQLVLESTFSSVYRGVQLMAGEAALALEISFDFAPPPHADKARRMLGKVKYQMSGNQMRFPRALLATPLPMHNPTALKFALEQCERENALQVNMPGQMRQKVKQLLLLGEAGYPDLEQVSDRLHMTARTLRRRLAQEGITYKSLVEEAKRRDAIRLLDDPDVPLHRIASWLGYQDPANFTRAFRQWTDQTPSQYRKTRNP